MRSLLHRLLAALALGSTACASSDQGAPLTVFNAAALGPPFRVALDSFAARRPGIRTAQENAPSLEVVRKVTELQVIPDILAVADISLLPTLVIPAYADWYVAFGTNALVLAFGPRARFVNEITPENWWAILQRPGVQVGRSDLRVDPSGYRADMVMQLAESFYRQPGLTARLRATIPDRNIRRAEADLSAHLEAGELDYGWTYENLAKAHGLRYVRLPSAIDLSDPAHASQYAAAEVTLPSAPGEPPLVMRGAPILFALTVPRAAPNRDLAHAFVQFLLSPDGATVLRQSGFSPLPTPRFEGHVPAVFRAPTG